MYHNMFLDPDKKFSTELKDLTAKSRLIAIDTGYDYITTIHFFLADCETKSESSLLHFAFKTPDEYQKFKDGIKIKSRDLLDLVKESLPLTVEVEDTIRMSETERKSKNHKLILSSDFFIAAFKNKNSHLLSCFNKDPEPLEKLITFYKKFEKVERIASTNKEMVHEQEKEKKMRNWLNSLFRIFKKV